MSEEKDPLIIIWDLWVETLVSNWLVMQVYA